MSEKYSAWSPYNYVINNPIMVIDPDGNDVVNISGRMMATGADAGFAFKAYVATMSTSTESSGNYFTEANFNQFMNGDDDPPGNKLSRFRTKTANWVQENIRGPLSGWFDKNTRNAFVLDEEGQARMDDLRGQMSGYMRSNVGGGIKWGTEHGLIGSGMGTGHVGKFIGPKEAMRKKIADFADKAEIYSGGQPSLAKNSEEIIEGYYRQMKIGIFKKPGAGFTTLDGKTVLTEGNHSMNAAIRYAIETGDIKNIKIILKGVDKTKVNLKTYGIPIRKFHTK